MSKTFSLPPPTSAPISVFRKCTVVLATGLAPPASAALAPPAMIAVAMPVAVNKSLGDWNGRLTYFLLVWRSGAFPRPPRFDQRTLARCSPSTVDKNQAPDAASTTSLRPQIDSNVTPSNKAPGIKCAKELQPN